jgi:hypothetical protein
MKVFILEDDPYRNAAFESALEGHDLTMHIDVASAISAYDPPYDLMLLDHDLGGEVYVNSEEFNTGYTFCEFLVSNPKATDRAVSVIVHSWNPEGGAAMGRLLHSAGYTVIREWFGVKLLNYLKGLPL